MILKIPVIHIIIQIIVIKAKHDNFYVDYKFQNYKISIKI